MLQKLSNVLEFIFLGPISEVDSWQALLSFLSVRFIPTFIFLAICAHYEPELRGMVVGTTVEILIFMLGYEFVFYGMPSLIMGDIDHLLQRAKQSSDPVHESEQDEPSAHLILDGREMPVIQGRVERPEIQENPPTKQGP